MRCPPTQTAPGRLENDPSASPVQIDSALKSSSASEVKPIVDAWRKVLPAWHFTCVWVGLSACGCLLHVEVLCWAGVATKAVPVPNRLQRRIHCCPFRYHIMFNDCFAFTYMYVRTQQYFTSLCTQKSYKTWQCTHNDDHPLIHKTAR